jgi:alpha,alpha-trehalose phosphorylase
LHSSAARGWTCWFGFAPRLPQALAKLAFSVLIRGRRVGVEVTHTEAAYSLTDGEPLEILHHEERLKLTAGRHEVRTIRALPARPRPSQPPAREPIRRRPSVDGG